MRNENLKCLSQGIASVEKQWYKKDPFLQKAEILAMKRQFPNAVYGYLPDGRMYWQVKVNSVSEEVWHLLAVYNSDHPNGNSVRVYPIKPNFDEIKQMVDEANVHPKIIPHTLRDPDACVYFSLTNVSLLQRACEREILSAVVYIKNALYWITCFQIGLSNQNVWDEFTGSKNQF